MAALWAYVTAKVRVRVRRVRVRVRTPNPNPYLNPNPNPNPNPNQLVDVISSSDPDTTIFRNQVRGGRGGLRARARPQVGTSPASAPPTISPSSSLYLPQPDRRPQPLLHLLPSARHAAPQAARVRTRAQRGKLASDAPVAAPSAPKCALHTLIQLQVTNRTNR